MSLKFEWPIIAVGYQCYSDVSTRYCADKSVSGGSGHWKDNKTVRLFISSERSVRAHRSPLWNVLNAGFRWMVAELRRRSNAQSHLRLIHGEPDGKAIESFVAACCRSASMIVVLLVELKSTSFYLGIAAGCFFGVGGGYVCL